MKKARVNRKDCVACGCCVRICCREAVQIICGVFSEIDRKKCVGCGICAKECPASCIRMEEAGDDE